MPKKLILFDIDGTLITTKGAAVQLIVESVSRVLGHPVRWNITEFVGNTDRNILSGLFRKNGCSEALLVDFVEEALQLYLERLPEILKNDGVVKVLPGVRKTLKTLDQDERFDLGLLTGNLGESARLKLSAAGLFHYFPVGAFGDDALKRDDLPPFALRRAEKYYGCFFDKGNVWIVGDSIHDIRCAQAWHLRSLGVASGHTTETDLKAFCPTAFVKDLKDQQTLLNIFSKNF